ncbi:hypothetical protein GGH92_009636 [Coemansia sp. RSA 2673]|nr:hypothetical protein GGH92_009636 [Coemansia sp. RSA 2673]
MLMLAAVCRYLMRAVCLHHRCVFSSGAVQSLPPTSTHPQLLRPLPQRSASPPQQYRHHLQLPRCHLPAPPANPKCCTGIQRQTALDPIHPGQCHQHIMTMMLPPHHVGRM